MNIILQECPFHAWASQIMSGTCKLILFKANTCTTVLEALNLKHEYTKIYAGFQINIQYKEPLWQRPKWQRIPRRQPDMEINLEIVKMITKNISICFQ